MKTVIITADGPEHRFVTRSLIDALGASLAGIVIERPANAQSFLFLLKKARRRYSTFTVLERIITKIVRKLLRSDQRQTAALHEHLGMLSPGSYLPENLPVIETETANSSESIAWLRNIEPDYLFVYGTNIIKKDVLSIPSRETLNLHTGISPYYRGCSCAFWPLYNKEPHMVGATVHKCTPEIDGGDIYGRISTRVAAKDDPFAAFAKSVESGAMLYARIANNLANGADVPAEKQDYTLGKEYRFTDKTFLHEIKMEAWIHFGKLEKTIVNAEKIPLPFSEKPD